MIRVTHRQVIDRLAGRPPEYMDDIRPSIVRVFADGGAECDETHPAWIAARAKYRPARCVTESPPAPWHAARVAACEGCRSAACDLAGFPPCTRKRLLADPRRVCPINRFECWPGSLMSEA
jgi:hypothetical protein